MYVYVLKSSVNASRYYVGLTINLKTRILEHNAGKSIYTKELRPWRIDVALWFADKNKAVLFEKYLKTQSGRAFRKHHF